MTISLRIALAINEAVERHERSYGDRWYLDGKDVIEAVADVLANEPGFDRNSFTKTCFEYHRA